jgi:hypothetical protein
MQVIHLQNDRWNLGPAKALVGHSSTPAKDYPVTGAPGNDPDRLQKAYLLDRGHKFLEMTQRSLTIWDIYLS